MRKWYFLLISIFILATALAFAGNQPSLDGKTFAGEVVEKGKAAGDKDELSFAEGKFHSKGCDPYGFGPTAYTAKQDGDSILFESHTTSEKEGSIHWTGKVTGEACEASFVWSKPGQKDIEYSFKGMLKK